MNFSLQMISPFSLKFRLYLEAFTKQYFYMRTLKWGERKKVRDRERETDRQTEVRAPDLIHIIIQARLRLD